MLKVLYRFIVGHHYATAATVVCFIQLARLPSTQTLRVMAQLYKVKQP